MISVNVRGLNNHLKRRKFFKWLVDHRIHIAFVQETYCKQRFKPYFDSGYQGDIFHSTSDSSHSRGVAVLISKYLNCKILNSISCSSGRKVMVNAEIDNQTISLISVYAPNAASERSEFFDNVKKWIELHSVNKNCKIVGGDMNCCLLDNDRNIRKHLKDKS